MEVGWVGQSRNWLSAWCSAGDWRLKTPQLPPNNPCFWWGSLGMLGYDLSPVSCAFRDCKAHVWEINRLLCFPQYRVFCPALTNYIGVCLAFSSFHCFVRFRGVIMLISIAFLFWHVWAWLFLWASRQPHCQRQNPLGKERAGSLFPSLSCCFCNPHLAVCGYSGLSVCSMWFADKRWSIGEELGCPCWEVLKRNGHPVSDCAWKLALTKEKKPTERTCRVCPCYRSWRLKSSEGQGINHKFKTRTPQCTERLYQELMLISLPLLQTKNTNPCDFYLLAFNFVLILFFLF